MADDQVQTLKEKFLDYFDQFARYAAENPKDFLLSCKIETFYVDNFNKLRKFSKLYKEV